MQVAPLDEIKSSLDKIFLAMHLAYKTDLGVVVPDTLRAVCVWSWLLAMTVLVTAAAISGWSEVRIWSKDYFEMLVFTCVSVPLLVEYMTDEPSVVKHALKGRRVLWKNSQVRNYFQLSRFDYAVMALLNDKMWLISDETASFTQQGGHHALRGDKCVTDTDTLARVGFYIGSTMARREWQPFNLKVSHGSDGSVQILNEESRASWISGLSSHRLVR